MAVRIRNIKTSMLLRRFYKGGPRTTCSLTAASACRRATGIGIVLASAVTILATSVECSEQTAPASTNVNTSAPLEAYKAQTGMSDASKYQRLDEDFMKRPMFLSWIKNNLFHDTLREQNGGMIEVYEIYRRLGHDEVYAIVKTKTARFFGFCFFMANRPTGKSGLTRANTEQNEDIDGRNPRLAQSVGKGYAFTE